MGVFYTNWQIAGVLMYIGEELKETCEEFNRDFDKYGLVSMECQYNIAGIYMAIKCLRAFPDIDVELETDNYGHYTKIQITSFGSPCGLPWTVEVKKNEE